MSTEHCAGFFLNTFDAILVGQLRVICGRGFMKIPLPFWGRDTPEYKRRSTEKEMVLNNLFIIYVGWRGLFEHIFPNIFKGLFVIDGCDLFACLSWIWLTLIKYLSQLQSG